LAIPAPDPDFDPGSAHIEDLGAGPLVRVYDWISARDKGYDPLGYKAIPSNDPGLGGRFDGTSADPYPFSYWGIGAEPLKVGLSEVAFNKARPAGASPRIQLLEKEVERLAFQAVFNSHDCPVLVLLTPEDCNRIGAPNEICWDPDYATTRIWAQWIRKKLPGIHGIRYFSRRTMADGNVITFGDRCRAGRSFDGGGGEYRFADRLGEQIIRRVALKAAIDIVP
jgi:hypothetical protein